MAYQIGSGSRCVASIQTGYGTASTPTQLLAWKSESISKTVTKEQEELLLSNILVSSLETTGISVGGNIEMNLRPEFADWLFEAVCNKAGTSASGVKTYTLCEPDATPKYSTIILERGTEVKKYSDMAVQSMSLTANAGQIVTVSISLLGKDEESGTFPTSPVSTVEKSYRCTNAILKYGEGGEDASTSLPVETLTLNVNNGLEEGVRTYFSGLLASEPSLGRRSITVDWTLPKGTDFDSIKNTYLEDGYLSLHLEFTNDGDTGARKVEIDIPNLSLQSASANVGGPQRIDGSLSAMAIQKGNGAPFTIKLHVPTT